jgi:hypothetical protein
MTEDWKKDWEKIHDIYYNLDVAGREITRIPPYEELARYIDHYGGNPDAVDTLSYLFNRSSSSDLDELSIIAGHAPRGSDLEAKAVDAWQKAVIEKLVDTGFNRFRSPTAMFWIMSSALSAPEGSLLEAAAIKLWTAGVEKEFEEQGLYPARRMLDAAMIANPPRGNLAAAAREMIQKKAMGLASMKPDSFAI